MIEKPEPSAIALVMQGSNQSVASLNEQGIGSRLCQPNILIFGFKPGVVRLVGTIVGAFARRNS